MAKYVGKRLVYMLVTLFVIVVLTFTLMKLLPGSPFDTERFAKLTVEQQEAALARYGLDQPIYVQFLKYLGNMLRGDFGTSFYYTNMPVTKVIFSRLGPSMLIGAQAILVGLAIGLSLGIVAACRHNGVVDNLTMIIAVLGISVPNFVVAALLQYYVGLKLGWLPVGFWKSWACSVLPSVALCFQPLATSARFIRAETLDVLQQDYITTARSKGMSQARLLIMHTLRNSIIPVVTLMASMVVNLLTGSLAIESIFSIPGIGGLFTESVKNNDYNVIMGLTMFYSAFYMIAILVVDVAYSLIDPRIRIAAGKGGE
ncbi:MAG: ABC transporter permease [Candidatus Faecivicinus sp.]